MSKSRNIIEYLENLLVDTNYIRNGELNRTLLIEQLRDGNESLYKLLVSDDYINRLFVKIINENKQFDIIGFSDVIQMKEYMPDSYTKYANEIGLTSSGRSINKLRTVVLDFPHKDSILVGGMTKEDNKNVTAKDLKQIGIESVNSITVNNIINEVSSEEIFLNEVVSYDDIQSLKEPKALVDATLYNSENIDGRPAKIYNGENLLIKGNNYIALNSLIPRFKGTISSIYLDPPYNTGSDSFKYNDKFNHSTWLTFMKNRLEIAYDLLSDDGHIIVQCDDNEFGYLKVLMDEIFNKDNFMVMVSKLHNFKHLNKMKCSKV